MLWLWEQSKLEQHYSLLHLHLAYNSHLGQVRDVKRLYANKLYLFFPFGIFGQTGIILGIAKPACNNVDDDAL